MWPKVIIYGLGGLFILDSFLLLLNVWLTRQFLQQVPQLETASDLRDYYKVVSRCMYLTFCFVIVFSAAVVITVAAVYASILRHEEIVSPWVMGIARIGLFSFLAVGQEQRLKEIPAASEELRHARNEIVRIWEQHPIPRRLTERTSRNAN